MSSCPAARAAGHRTPGARKAITLFENFRAVFYAPFYAAFALGAFAAEGVEVRLETSPAPARTAAALLEGRGQVGWGGPMRVIAALGRDPRCGLAAFCEVAGRDPFFIVGRGPAPGPEVTGLLGRTVATVSEVPTPWLCLQHDLRLAGADPARLRRAPAGTMAESAAALRAGAVEAIQVFEPLAEELVREGAGRIWYAAARRGPTSYTSFYATREVIAREADALYRMTRAVYRTQKWLSGRGAGEVAACVGEFFPAVRKETLAGALGRYQALGVWNDAPALSREGFAWLAAACRAGGLTGRAVAFEEAVDESFAGRALAEDPPPM